MFYSLEKEPKMNDIVKFPPNIIYQIKVKKIINSIPIYDFVQFDGNIVYNIQQYGEKLIIILGDKEYELNINRSSNILKNIVAIYSEYKIYTTTQAQISGFSDGSNITYLSNEISMDELEYRLDNMFQYLEFKNVLIEDPNTKYIYYKKSGIIVKIHQKNPFNQSDRNYQNYLIIVKIKINKNICEIIPYSYRNIMLNSYYNASIVNLFEIITAKLNEFVKPLIPYANLPDSFFHMHVVNIQNENKIILVLHAKYEIENIQENKTINYIYEDQYATKYKIKRIKNLNNFTENEINNLRKLHSFYFLFDLDTNEHYLFAIRDSNNIKWNLPNSIGLNANSFGPNICDINYIIGRPIILTIQTNTKCELFC
jgi:hypothetical protein